MTSRRLRTSNPPKTLPGNRRWLATRRPQEEESGGSPPSRRATLQDDCSDAAGAGGDVDEALSDNSQKPPPLSSQSKEKQVHRSPTDDDDSIEGRVAGIAPSPRADSAQTFVTITTLWFGNQPPIYPLSSRRQRLVYFYRSNSLPENRRNLFLLSSLTAAATSHSGSRHVRMQRAQYRRKRIASVLSLLV